MVKVKKVILGVTGGIAAYKACEIIRRLQDKNIEVSVIMTKEAEQFVTPLTFATLTGSKVYREMFDQDHNSWESAHIPLAQSADVLLIAPATANMIGKIANGLADDLLSCVAMAASAPIVIAPAMNDQMYKNKIVQDNIQRLRKIGIRFVDPIKGKLACGTKGIGHLAEVEDIVKETMRSLK
ncbi:MAG: bifunctional phosphopantothenoylcysteine decarboxylase/phosphopantothenate--cysteine ligase CoaBC [Candidatus Omnitrophota bacterium]